MGTRTQNHACVLSGRTGCCAALKRRSLEGRKWHRWKRGRIRFHKCITHAKICFGAVETNRTADSSARTMSVWIRSGHLRQVRMRAQTDGNVPNMEGTAQCRSGKVSARMASITAKLFVEVGIMSQQRPAGNHYRPIDDDMMTLICMAVSTTPRTLWLGLVTQWIMLIVSESRCQAAAFALRARQSVDQ